MVELAIAAVIGTAGVVYLVRLMRKLFMRECQWQKGGSAYSTRPVHFIRDGKRIESQFTSTTW